jgi:hypothetical protein
MRYSSFGVEHRSRHGAGGGVDDMATIYALASCGKAGIPRVSMSNL